MDYTISVLKFTKKMLNKFHLIWHSKNLFNSLKHPRISHTNGKESMNQMSFTSAEMFLFSLIKTLNSNRVEAMSTLRYCLRCLSPCSKWFFTNKNYVTHNWIHVNKFELRCSLKFVEKLKQKFFFLLENNRNAFFVCNVKLNEMKSFFGLIVKCASTS